MMKAAYYDTFKGPITVREVPKPVPGPDDVVIKVMATGLCRSDWHGWQGHDSDIHLPHVPGHEFAGIIEVTGSNIRKWKPGDRVTVPFCLGCGRCPQCQKGQQQICDHYHQPGFTGWGSFAEYVLIHYAAENLVRLPDSLDFDTAAVLGCRFITSWRGLTAHGQIPKGGWVAIHGCGGIGLSAILIATALGARVIAIDIDDTKLEFARQLGARHTLDATKNPEVHQEIRDMTGGGADISIDALGSRETCRNSILSLRKQGRHIQLGLLAGSEADPPLPMSAVIARELTLCGSHGMQAHQYPEMLKLIESGILNPKLLVGKTVTLEAGVEELMALNRFRNTGVTVIRF